MMKHNGKLKVTTFQDAMQKLSKAVTLQQILAQDMKVDEGLHADVPTVVFSDSERDAWDDEVRRRVQSAKTNEQGKLKTRTVVLATAAYAVIETPERSMDVRLEPGRSAAKSLRESVTEMRERAARINRDADFIEAAIPDFDVPSSC